MLGQLSILARHTRQPAHTYMCNPMLGNWEVRLEFCQGWHKQEILNNIDLAKPKSGAMLLFFKTFHMINLFKLKAFQKKKWEVVRNTSWWSGLTASRGLSPWGYQPRSPLLHSQSNCNCLGFKPVDLQQYAKQRTKTVKTIP